MEQMLIHLIAYLFALTGAIFGQELNAHSNLLTIDSLGRLSYIVMMNQKPLSNINANERRRYKQQLETSHIESMSEAGIDPITDCTNHYFHSINGYSAFMTEEQSQIIAQQTNVKSILKDSIVTPDTDASPQFLELTSLPNGAYANDINGEDVVIGFLDTGIWPEHPSFMDDGTYNTNTKISKKIPCNFGNTDFNPDDIPFECNNKILGARRCMNTYDAVLESNNISYRNGTFLSARDDNSHGTFGASTAAGNRDVEAYTLNDLVQIDFGKISGIANRAQIVAYKVLGSLGGTWSDLTQCIDYAVEDKVDVINLSGGGGIHTSIGSVTPEAAFFEAVKQGIFAVKSAGGNGRLGEGTINIPGGDPWLCTVAASSQPRLWNAKIKLKEIFHTNRKKLIISNGMGIIPTKSVSLSKSPWVPLINGGECDKLTVETAQGKIILCKNNLFDSLSMIARVREVNGLGVIYWAQSYKPLFFRQPNDMLFATIWFEEGQKIERYINESSDINNVLIKVTNRRNIFDAAPSIAVISSRGPNRAAFDIIKPDITAPGVMILAGISPNNYNDRAYRPGELFWNLQGTSFSTAHISGIGALIKQVHPHWGPDYIKSAIMTTAYQNDILDSDFLTDADVFDYGSGHVNPGNNFNLYSNSQSIIKPGLVYPVTENDYNSALCENTTLMTPQVDVCDDLLDQGYTNLMTDLNQPNIGVIPFNDVATVRRYVVSVASGTNRFKVEINEPKGIEVNVSPKVLKLSENERGDYTVTFSVTSTTILDEFHFGNLIWKTDIYNVYSSIAVYPSST